MALSLVKSKPPAKLGPPIDLRGNNELPDLLEKRSKLKDDLKEIQDSLKRIEDEVEQKIGDAIETVCDGWRVSQNIVERKEFTVPASSYIRKSFARIGRRRA